MGVEAQIDEQATAVFFGQCALETTSSTQSLRALSIGEAEFYALTKAAAHSEQLAGVMKDIGNAMRVVVGPRRDCQRIAPKCAGCPQTSIQLTLQHSTLLALGWKQNMDVNEARMALWLRDASPV